MKKTWMTAGLAALLVLPLAGCAGDKTGSDVGTTPGNRPSPAPTQTVPSPDMMPDPEDGWEDLAGADGIVGGDSDQGLGSGNTNAPGQADNSPLEDLGEGIGDTLNDLGDAARNVGRDVGDAARDMGRDARDMIDR